MARSFGRVMSSVWSDEQWCDLTPDAQRLHMLLASQRSLSLAAALSLTPKRWARYSSNTTQRDIERALHELSDTGWVAIDEETDELVIPAVLADDLNAGRLSAQVAKGFWSAWDALDSRPLRRVVVRSLADDVWEKLEQTAPLDAVHFRRSSPIDREPPPPIERKGDLPTDSGHPPRIETNGSTPVASESPSPTDSTRARLSTVDGRSSMVDGRCESPPPEDEPEPEGDPEASALAKASTDPALADARRLCQMLADSIASRQSKPPTVTSKWIGEMDRLMRLDGHTAEDVEKVIRWLHEGRDDVASFWQPNIRSPQKLRAQWDQMREQHLRERRASGRSARDEQAWDDSRAILHAVGSDVNPIDLMMRRNGR